MKNLLLLCACIAAALAAPSMMLAQPVVINVTANQRPSGDRAVEISYDLSGGNGPMTVSVLVSNDNGTTFSITPQSQYLTGDVGAGVANGTGHSIVWDAMADVPEIYWPETRVRVVAEESAPTPTPTPVPEPTPTPTPTPAPTPFLISLAITSTLAEGSVSETQNQTLTFTFGQSVTGFDASDVTVTGATKGAFSGSGSVYTLEVTGTGGTVTASVPQNVVSPGNEAATFSNYYQDTWTIELQESPLVTMDLIRIPAGTFMMGSPSGELSRQSNETQHQVTISQGFYLGKTQVTQAQWLAIQGSWPGTAPSATYGVGDNFPAYYVSHGDIQTFLTNLNTAIIEPGTFSLPTESQWEYACRAGTTTRFNFGDGLSTDEICATGGGREDNMWYCWNSGLSTQLVGQKPANAWGLHDMHGNVWEWCADRYGTYPTGPVTDPTGPASGTLRVLRGGSWNNFARGCRSAERFHHVPWGRDHRLGFRVLAVRPMSLTITSSETESFHQTGNQTLTFMFDGPVSDFTADDVSLTGATKGTFTEISPSVYTLEITGTGGMIAASVLKSPATAPATFSNFYQDTWMIELQESPLVTMDLIRIPAGTFIMGSPVGELSRDSNETQHEVTISQDFYLGKTQVTQEQWLAIYDEFPDGGQSHGTGSGSETRAVHRVSHNDIMDASTGFMKRLNDHITDTSQGPATATLPTEAQWEYACRAGTTTRFNFGDGLSTDESCATGGGREDNMWYCGNNSPIGTKLVGQFPANAWGLHDMHGNVWEWCADWFGTYPAGPVTDPTGPATGSFRVLRGGSWSSNARYCRSARRIDFVPSSRFNSVGFRVAAVR